MEGRLNAPYNRINREINDLQKAEAIECMFGCVNELQWSVTQYGKLAQKLGPEPGLFCSSNLQL